MKDLYSPLEIDEEWDQRAPDMTGGESDAGTAVAVAPDPSVAPIVPETVAPEANSDLSESTLPPDPATETQPVVADTAPAEMPMSDPAHDVAEAAVEGHDTGPTAINETVGNDTLEYHEMGDEGSAGTTEPEATTSTEVGEDEVAVDSNMADAGATESEAPEPMKVNVMGDGDTDEGEPSSVPEAGAVIEPQVKPEGMEDEVVAPEPKEETEESKDEVEESELPASPVKTEEEPKEEAPETDMKEGGKEDAPELKSFKDRLEQQRQANIEAALRIKERAEEFKKREQQKADEAMANVQDAETEIAEVEDELSKLEYKEAA